MKNIKNKRGDVPVTILVIGVVAICLMTIATFYISNHSAKKELDSVGVVEKAAVAVDRISFYHNLNLDSEIEKVFNVQTDPDTKKKYISFEQDGLSVRYNLP